MTRRLVSTTRSLVISITCVVTTAGPAAAQSWRVFVSPESTVDIGKIHNAPNGHISYQQVGRDLTLWVDGRVFDGASPKGTQGTFLLHPASWSTADLEAAKPLLVFKATHDTANHRCDAPSAWYRNYAAINAVIPGPKPGELLAFIDGEFHPDTTGTPLHASIGVATSSDGAVNWTQPQLIIQGQNMVAARFNCHSVDSLMKRRTDNVGAAGPSAVVRTDGNRKYIYVYYLDRILGTQSVAPSAAIYVARSPYDSAGAPGSWEFWLGGEWSKPGREVIAKPVVAAQTGRGEAAQPQVTYNTGLKRWLMVFHTSTDLYATSSQDGTTWDAQQPLGAATANNRSPAFPTLVSSSSSDQQTTDSTGVLFYSREVTASGGKRKSYPGYFRSFTIRTLRKPPCSTPRQCCEANGGNWSGGRCS